MNNTLNEQNVCVKESKMSILYVALFIILHFIWCFAHILLHCCTFRVSNSKDCWPELNVEGLVNSGKFSDLSLFAGCSAETK